MPAPRAPHAARPTPGVAGLIRLAWASLLACSVLLLPMQPSQAAWGLSWPSLGRPEQAGAKPERMLAPQPPAGRLQEVQPPVAVQQLQQALADRTPNIEILSPRDGATLGDGPWQLKLRVRDWPLADGGPLGLGAHVVVQVDGQALQRISGADAAAWQPADASPERSLVIPQEPLSPGSHRITVYAARPWGEAVKSPGAAQQIRVHQLAANPLSLPTPGSPQLLPVSPDAANGAEPLLLDWLLLDAPLQHLRDGDGSWRLRVTINGDSFVLDQAVPLWLRGWKSGRNSLQLELLDGSGAALNAPFNSFVRAIELAAPGSEHAAEKPRWQQGRLSADELAILLGEQPPTPPEPPEAPAVDPRQQQEDLEQPLAQGEPDDRTEPTTQQPASPERSTSQEQATPSPEQQEPPLQELQDEREGADTPEQEQLNEAEVSSEPTSADTAASPAESEQQDANQPLAPPAEKREGEGEPESEPQSEPQSALQAEPLSEQLSEPKTEAAAELEPNPRDQHNPETQLAISGLVESSGSVNVVPGAEGPSLDTSGLELSAPEPEASEASSPALPLQIAPPERISSSTPLGGSARDQVNPDGSLIQPSPNGPLAGLRHLLGGS